ncbi:hypothetical protein [Mycoplasmopsis agalactiae]|uniref:hypothetical protein n=1 Tax=Mycoplasmopsis agalactiae TaxID=2110 RepID=UPI001F1E1461|nr:hypothetical protein [Mycoplasmopsis agalactiae]
MLEAVKGLKLDELTIDLDQREKDLEEKKKKEAEEKKAKDLAEAFKKEETPEERDEHTPTRPHNYEEIVKFEKSSF